MFSKCTETLVSVNAVAYISISDHRQEFKMHVKNSYDSFIEGKSEKPYVVVCMCRLNWPFGERILIVK